MKSWYTGGPDIERRVIRYQKGRSRSKKLPAINLINTKTEKNRYTFIRVEQNYVFELELDKIFFYFYKILDDGQRPQIEEQPGGKLGIFNIFSKKPAPKKNRLFYEFYTSRSTYPLLYFLRKATIHDVFMEISTYLKLNPEKCRLIF